MILEVYKTKTMYVFIQLKSMPQAKYTDGNRFSPVFNIEEGTCLLTP